MIHIIDLDDEEYKGDPSARESSRCKAVEKSPVSMRGQSCKDGDRGGGVEDKVEDCQGQLQLSAPLPAGVSKKCDGKGFPEHALH